MMFFLSLLTITVFFQYSFYQTEFQKYFTFLDEIIVFIFLLAILAGRINKSLFRYKKTPLDNIIMVFALLFPFSMIINGTPLIPFLWCMKNFFLYTIVYYCITSSKISVITISKIVRLIIIIFLIQVPIVLGDLITSIFVYGLGNLEADAIRGLLPGANILSAATLFPLFLYLGYNKFQLKSSMKKIITLCLLILLIAGAGRLAIIIFIFSIIYLFRKKFQNYSNLRITKLLAILFSFILLISIYYFASKEDIVYNFNIYHQLTKQEFSVSSGSQRLLYYPLTFKILSEQGLIHFLFGLGPGMYGSDAGMRLNTPWSEYLGNVFGQMDAGFDPYVSSQIIPIWGELGIIGLFVFFWMFFKIFLIAKKVYSNSWDPLFRSLSVSVICGCFLMLIGSFVHNYYELQVVQYPFWLLTAFLIKMCYMTENRNNII